MRRDETKQRQCKNESGRLSMKAFKALIFRTKKNTILKEKSERKIGVAYYSRKLSDLQYLRTSPIKLKNNNFRYLKYRTHFLLYYSTCNSSADTTR